MSADKPATQQKFIDKFGLTFPLISDPDNVIIDAYGSQGVLGVVAQRATFLVDPQGRIAHVWPKVNVRGHAEDVLGVIRRTEAETAEKGPDS